VLCDVRVLQELLDVAGFFADERYCQKQIARRVVKIGLFF